MTLRINAFGVRLNCIISAKGNVNQTALISIHRRKRNAPMRSHCTLCSGLSHRSNLILSAALVALNVNNNRIPKAKLAAYKQREQYLESIKRATMTTNQYGKVGSGDVKNQLALITLVLIDRRIIGIEVRKNGTKNRDGNIGNGIKLVIGKLNASLIVLGNLGVITHNLRGFLLDILGNFFNHGELH